MTQDKDHNTKRKAKNQRTFNVGIVGASENEIDAITRIFAVTNFRKRCYTPKRLITNQWREDNNVDFILIFTENPVIIQAWRNTPHCHTPPIYLSKSGSKKHGKYHITSPINPGKFVQLLDQYTIKELNYFPEFEIGSESSEIDTMTISGLKALRANHLAQTNHADPQQKNVLVVDDSLAVRRQMLLEFQLRQDHLDVVATAEDAIQAIDKKHYDMIFLDVVMPGMDGYTACKKIKKNRLNSDTPVVLLTSKSSSFDKIKGALAGCDAYLVKPINHNEFEDIYEKFTQAPQRGEHAHVG